MENLFTSLKACNQKLNGAEAALYLEEMYYSGSCYMEDPKSGTSILRTRVPSKNTPDELVFGPTLMLDEEDVYSCTMYEQLVTSYTEAEIKKFFGYTLEEYLNLTFYEADVLRRESNRLKKQIMDAIDNVQQNKNTDITNNNNVNVPGNIDDEIFGE